MEFSGSKWILAAIVVLISVEVCNSCSCMPTHPQQQYCQSDFVILARIKREFTFNDTRVYKVKIRKELKMSEKSTVALKSGRLITSLWGSMCGVKLDTGKLYVIGGKVLSLKAHINLCGLTERWEYLTQRQRKGMNRMYQVGCTCGIRTCFRGSKCHKVKDYCNWTTFNYNVNLDCQKTQNEALGTWAYDVKLNKPSQNTRLLARRVLPKPNCTNSSVKTGQYVLLNTEVRNK